MQQRKTNCTVLDASKGVGLAVNTKRDEENVYKTVYKMMLTKKIRAD